MMKWLNVVFLAKVALFCLIILDILPRSFALYGAIGFSLYLILASLENGVIFFVRLIPLFIALPFTESFDNFNEWRIYAFIIAIKWIFQKETRYYLGHELKTLIRKPYLFFKDHPIVCGLFILLVLSMLSVYPAQDKMAAVKRIIYFLNAGLIGTVIYFETQFDRIFRKRLIKNISIPVIIAAGVGYVQLISTYLIDIYQFMRIWGEGIQLKQFGTMWSYIAIHLGNTWFAYYGEQLSLRVFSLFPDSHSFPVFLLLGLPALFALSLVKPIRDGKTLTRIARTRGSWFTVSIPFVFLIIILSGTRGIWAASIIVILWVLILLGYMHWKKVDQQPKTIFKYLTSYLIIFFLCFSIAYPVFVSPQFLLSKGDLGLLRNRIKSIIDFGETSNSQRLVIWRDSVESINKRPFLGVGIGNFPVVLKQDIRLAKAGSSAHNLYLNIAAEMGILALLAALFLIWKVIQSTYRNYISEADPFFRIYCGMMLISLPWVLVYALTDVAIFDERALLLFFISLALSSW